MKKIILFFLLFFISIRINASIVVMDGLSGRVLYSKNMNDRMLIASTTKIMTCLIALENAQLDDMLEVGEEIKQVYGSMLYIKEKERFTLNDLLHGLMLQSGNDASMVIATKTLGYDNFIAKMNIKAYMLGMYNTSFENPHGLNDETYNYSTAYDMAILMKYAINNKDFINITSQKKYKVGNYIWYNKNKLLSDYNYTLSGKIGYTKKSGPVFVSAARKDGKTLIIVSINESDKFNLHKNLYKKFFNEYKKYTILNKNTFSFKVNSNNNDHYYLKNNYYMLLKEDEIKNLKIEINLNNSTNFVKVTYGDDFVHKEKLYKLSYNDRIKKIKSLLSFK